MDLSYEEAKFGAAERYVAASFREQNLRHRLAQSDKHFVDSSFRTVGNAELHQSKRETSRTSRRSAMASALAGVANAGCWAFAAGVPPTPLLQITTYLLMGAGVTSCAVTASAKWVELTVRQELHDRRDASIITDEWTDENADLERDLANAIEVVTDARAELEPFLAEDQTDLRSAALEIVRAHEQLLLDSRSTIQGTQLEL